VPPTAQQSAEERWRRVRLFSSAPVRRRYAQCRAMSLSRTLQIARYAIRMPARNQRRFMRSVAVMLIPGIAGEKAGQKNR